MIDKLMALAQAGAQTPQGQQMIQRALQAVAQGQLPPDVAQAAQMFAGGGAAVPNQMPAMPSPTPPMQSRASPQSAQSPDQMMLDVVHSAMGNEKGKLPSQPKDYENDDIDAEL